MPPDDLDIRDRKAVARYIVRLRYPAVHPDTNVTTTLDEDFEKLQLVEFYNKPVASWLRGQGWGWIVLETADLAGVTTVRDFGGVCYRHLAPLETGGAPDDIVGEPGGSHES